MTIEPIAIEGMRNEIYGESRIGRYVPDEPWANEPTIAVRELDDAVVIALADGTASWEDGREGSRRAVQLLANALASARDPRGMEEAFETAAGALAQWNASRTKESDFRKGPPQVDCSVVTCVILRDRVLIAWMGGAVGYVVRDGEVLYATEHDTLGARLVADGSLRVEDLATFENADILLSTFGVEPPCSPARQLSCPRIPGAFVLLAARGASAPSSSLRAGSARALVLAQLSSYEPDCECAAIAAPL